MVYGAASAMLNNAPAASELNFPYVLYLVYNTATAVASHEHERMNKTRGRQ